MCFSKIFKYKTAKVIEILKKSYLEAKIGLRFSTDFELLVATLRILLQRRI